MRTALSDGPQSGPYESVIPGQTANLAARRPDWPSRSIISSNSLSFALINAGSSSLKFCVFVGHAKQEWQLAARGQIDGIGTSPRLSVKDDAGARMADEKLDASVKDGRAALAVGGVW